MKIVLFDNDVSCLVRFRGEFAQDLQRAGFDVRLLVPIQSKEEKLLIESLNLPYEHIALSRSGISIGYLFKEFAEVRRKIISLQPDILFNYTAKPFLFGSIVNSLFGAGVTYSMLPGLGFLFLGDSFKKKLLRFVVCQAYRLAFLFNKKVFILNEDDRKELLGRRLLSESKLVNIRGEGVDLCAFKTDVDSKLDEIVFMFAGRLIKEKGVNDFVEAAKILKPKYSNVSFRVAGNIDQNPGSLSSQDLQELVDSGVIDYIGFTTDIKREFEKTSVFVLPSFYREGLPRSIMESLAMRVPVITTLSPGCRESIGDGETGFLVPPRNPAKLAEKMEYFINNPDCIETMGERARVFAENIYDIRKINQQIISYLPNHWQIGPNDI